MSSKPPPPDPNLGQSSMEMANVAREQLGFNRQVYEEGKPRQAAADALADRLVTQQMEIADESRGRAGEMWNRWKSDFAPIEGEFAKIATDAGSVAEQETAANTAAADIRQGTTASQNQLIRQGLRYGFSPEKMASVATAAGNSQGLAQAGAMNNARTIARDRGVNLKAQAINVGRGLPALGLNNDQMALAGGQGAAASSMVGNNLLASRVGGMNQGFNAFQQGIGNAFDASSAQHQSAVNATNARNQTKATGLAAVGTMAAMAMSDRRLKENIEQVGLLSNGLPVYAFDYIDADRYGQGRFIGVMADELEKVRPAAVLVNEDGFSMVDYSQLADLTMTEIH